MANSQIGSSNVVALWRYPVKSMMGEELNAAEITERGLLADRAYALVDSSTGKIVSAKNPRKWPNIFDFRAAFVESPRADGKVPEVRITLPDGTLVTSDQANIDEALSSILGRQVMLKSSAPDAPSLEEYWPDIDGLANREATTDETIASASPGTFFDCAPVHLLTTATLDRLHEAYPQGRFEGRRFRPNIIVRPLGESGFVENDWVGRTVAIGSGVRLKVIAPCPRCVMTTLAQDDLPQDVGILRAIAKHNTVRIPIVEQEMPSVGVYAVVSRAGAIRRGDPVSVE